VAFVKLPLAPGVDVAGFKREKPWPASRDAMVRQFLTTRDGERLTQSELALRAGLSRRTVSRLVEGQGRPLLHTGILVARVLDRPATYVDAFSTLIRQQFGRKPREQYGWMPRRRKTRLLADELAEVVRTADTSDAPEELIR
jgi:transcriptional regulator with XRE-family HTH domain